MRAVNFRTFLTEERGNTHTSLTLGTQQGMRVGHTPQETGSGKVHTGTFGNFIEAAAPFS